MGTPPTATACPMKTKMHPVRTLRRANAPCDRTDHRVAAAMHMRTRGRAPATAAARTVDQDTDPTTSRWSPARPSPGPRTGQQVFPPPGGRTSCHLCHERMRGKLRGDVGRRRIYRTTRADCRARGAGLAAIRAAPDPSPPPGPTRSHPLRRPVVCRQPRGFSARPASRHATSVPYRGCCTLYSDEPRATANVAAGRPNHTIGALHPASTATCHCHPNAREFGYRVYRV